MRILNSNNKNFYNELDKILDRRKVVDRTTLKIVEKIIDDVRKNKDKALIKYEKRFNANSRIIPSKKDISKAIKSINPKIKKAIDETCKRVKDWHWHQKPKDFFYKDASIIFLGIKKVLLIKINIFWFDSQVKNLII